MSIHRRPTGLIADIRPRYDWGTYVLDVVEIFETIDAEPVTVRGPVGLERRFLALPRHEWITHRIYEGHDQAVFEACVSAAQEIYEEQNGGRWGVR